MGNYEQLKQAVSDVIKTNGNQEITGQILQNALLSIISTVGGNATFAGIATPETNPGTPDQNVFYIAIENGTYSNFESIILSEEVAILSNKGSSWVKSSTGIATSAKVTELELNNVSINTLNLIDQSKIKTSTLIDSSGIEVAGSWGDSYKCTDFIPINLNNIICDNTIFKNWLWPSYAVYDEQKRFLRAIFENQVYAYQSGDVYVRLNLYTSLQTTQANYGSVLSPYTPYNPIEGYIKQLDLAKASILDNKVNVAYINLIDISQIKFGYILKSNGAERKIDGVHYGYIQNYIPVSENFTWNDALADGSNNSICVYDENKDLLRGIELPSVSGPDYIAHYEYQQGDAFIRVNFAYNVPSFQELRGNYGDTLLDYTPYNPIQRYLSETETEISNLDTRVTNLENRDSGLPYLTGMFNNCICIGDSITAGWRENVGNLKNYSYPATLKKLTNWEMTNAATGGQTASGWMADTVYGGASQHDFSQHDIAIIFLGQNSEEDTSYRTNMQAIIDLLKNANSLIRIFMLVRSMTTSGHWGIAQEIATSNNIPLFNIYSQDAAIDLRDNLYHKMMANLSGYDTVHFNTLGYNALGKVVFQFINDYIYNNKSDFKNIGDSVDL